MTKRSNSCDFVYAVRPCGALVLMLVCELLNFRQHSKSSGDAGSVCGFKTFTIFACFEDKLPAFILGIFCLSILCIPCNSAQKCSCTHTNCLLMILQPDWIDQIGWNVYLRRVSFKVYSGTRHISAAMHPFAGIHLSSRIYIINLKVLCVFASWRAFFSSSSSLGTLNIIRVALFASHNHNVYIQTNAPK